MLAQERQELQKCFSCNGLLLLIMAIRWIGMRERIRKNMYCVAEKKGKEQEGQKRRFASYTQSFVKICMRLPIEMLTAQRTRGYADQCGRAGTA